MKTDIELKKIFENIYIYLYISQQDATEPPDGGGGEGEAGGREAPSGAGGVPHPADPLTQRLQSGCVHGWVGFFFFFKFCFLCFFFSDT